jgi:hypothetical protein
MWADQLRSNTKIPTGVQCSFSFFCGLESSYIFVFLKDEITSQVKLTVRSIVE